LEVSPSPKAIVKIEPRTTLGMELKAFDVRAEDVREQPVGPQDDPEDHAADHLGRETHDSLLEGDRDLLPERPLRGAIDDPGVQLGVDAGRLAVVERVDDLGSRADLPPTDEQHRQGDAQRVDQLLAAAVPLLERPAGGGGGSRHGRPSQHAWNAHS